MKLSGRFDYAHRYSALEWLGWAVIADCLFAEFSDAVHNRAALAHEERRRRSGRILSAEHLEWQEETLQERRKRVERT